MPRPRLDTADGTTTEWRSSALRAHQRRTLADRRADCVELSGCRKKPRALGVGVFPITHPGLVAPLPRGPHRYLILAKHSFSRSSSTRICDSMAPCNATEPLLNNSPDAFLSKFSRQSRIACFVDF